MANCCSSKSSNRETRSSDQTVVPSNEDIRTKIVHGDDAVQGEFPYQVCKHMKNHFTAAQITYQTPKINIIFPSSLGFIESL